MKKHRLSAVLMIVTVLTMIVLPGQAAYSGGPLLPGKLDININIMFIPHQDFTATTISHMNEALREWNSKIGSNVMSRASSSRHNYSDFSNNTDGNNRIYRYGNPNNTSVGENRTYTDWWSNLVYESDIWINTHFPFNNSPRAGYYDTWSIFLHEAGHTARLGDNDVYQAAVMYESASVILGSSRRYITHQQEIRALDYLYG